MHWTEDNSAVVNVTQLAPTWPIPPSAGTTPHYLIGNTQVMKDSATGQFVLWVSVAIGGLDSDPRPDSDFEVAVAETTGTSATPCSTYTWQRQNAQGQGVPWEPFHHPVGDIGLFTYTDPVSHNTYSYLTDADQLGNSCSVGDNPCYKAKAVDQGEVVTTSACQSGDTCYTGSELRVFLINPSSDTGLEGTVLQMGGSFEAPAMFQAGSGSGTTFFLLASHKTNWVPNANQYNFSKSAPPESTTDPVWPGWQGQPAGSQTVVPDTSWTDVYPGDVNTDAATYTCDYVNSKVMAPGTSSTVVNQTPTSSNTQQWYIESEGSIPDLTANGSSTPVYAIVNVNSAPSGVLDSPATTQSTGTVKLLSSFPTSLTDYSADWEFVSVTKSGQQYLTLKNVGNGLYLDLPASGALDVTAANNTPNQDWALTQISVP